VQKVPGMDSSVEQQRIQRLGLLAAAIHDERLNPLIQLKRLRADRYILTRTHRECATNKAGKTGDGHTPSISVGRRNAQYQAGNRKHAIIRTEDARAQPGRTVGTMNV
jgi:hypothetical protein